MKKGTYAEKNSIDDSHYTRQVRLLRMLCRRLSGRCHRADGIAHFYHRGTMHELQEMRMGVSVGSDPVPSGRSRGVTKDTNNVFKSFRYTEVTSKKFKVENGKENVMKISSTQHQITKKIQIWNFKSHAQKSI